MELNFFLLYIRTYSVVTSNAQNKVIMHSNLQSLHYDTYNCRAITSG